LQQSCIIFDFINASIRNILKRNSTNSKMIGREAEHFKITCSDQATRGEYHPRDSYGGASLFQPQSSLAFMTPVVPPRSSATNINSESPQATNGLHHHLLYQSAASLARSDVESARLFS
jgi:hypothetical protein